MASLGEEEIGAIVYTALLEWSVPCCASDLCENVRGLKRKQETVNRLLQTMCDNGIAVNVRGKYILKECMENMTPDPVERVSSLTYDGPTNTTTPSSNQMTGVARMEAVNVQAGARDVVRTEGVNVQTEAIVPVQQSAVQRSTSSYSTCDNTEVEEYTDILDKIIECLKSCSGSIKAKDIAQRTGLGKARSNVNRFLYFLKEKNVTDVNKTEWTLIGHVTRDDLKVYAAELAKKPGGKSTKALATLPDQSNDRCDCKNAGPGCTHVTNRFEQHNHYHYNNIQIGDRNRMLDDIPPDGPPTRGSR